MAPPKPKLELDQHLIMVGGYTILFMFMVTMPQIWWMFGSAAIVSCATFGRDARIGPSWAVIEMFVGLALVLLLMSY